VKTKKISLDKKTPEVLEHAVKCYICLGIVKKGEPVVECGGCGKTFHVSCAHRVEKCPICNMNLPRVKDVKKKASVVRKVKEKGES
jgi:rRNA maturation endonuclease Nob1